MNPKFLRRFSAALVLLAGTTVILQAQTPSAASAKKDEVVELSTFIVTGSNIPMAADASDVPVVVIGQQDIQQTGLNSNLLEILRKRLPSIAGRSNAGNSNANNVNQNTAGGSQIALRNLDTLILINGRRVATSGINGVGGKSFVDINQIPAAAIERMEVLTDGASAIYGSDAIGGVVNIILKSNYQGAEMGGRYAAASGGGNYNERSGYVVAGASANGVNVTASGSWSKTTPLYQKDRPFARDFTGKTAVFPGVAGGALLSPTLNSPKDKNPVGANATATSVNDLIANGTYLAASNPSIAPGISSRFNLAPYQTMLLQQEQRSATVNVSAELLGKKLVAFGDYMFSNTKSFNQTFLALNNLTTVTVPAGAPYNPLTGAFAGVVFGNLATPEQFHNNSKGNRLTVGVRGDINPDWNWEAGYTLSENKLTQQIKNVVYTPNIARAIAGGFNSAGVATPGGAFSRVISGFSENTGTFVIQPALDPFARGGWDPTSLANLYGTEVIQTKSRLESYDAKLVGTPFALPAGKVGFAVGAATRKETLSGSSDENGTNTGPHRWTNGRFFDAFTKSRTIDAYYAEARAPITSSKWEVPGAHALDLSVAGRAEKYSDAGKSNVPKLGARWQPVDEQATVRFTYSKSFTAPTLISEFGPTSTTTTGPAVLFSALGDPAFNGLVMNSKNGNNPGLKPAQAWSRSIGIVVSPKAIKGLTLTFDYVNVTEKGFMGGIGAINIVQSVDKYGAASPFAANFAFGNFPGQTGSTPVTGPGQITSYLKGGGVPSNMYLADYFVNLAGVRVQALDVSAEYELSTQSAGKFSFSTAGTFFRAFQFRALPDLPFYEYAGFVTTGGPLGGTIPKYRFYSTVDWTYHHWDVTLGNTYIPAVTDINTGGFAFATSTTLKPQPVDRYLTWDLQVGYTVGKSEAAKALSFLKGMRLSLGVNNVFNRMPPYDPQASPDNNVELSTYSPVGRLYFAAASVKF